MNSADLEALRIAWSALLGKLPHVRDEFFAEVMEMSREELQCRVLIQSDWLGRYSRCLDGLELRMGVEAARDPQDVRRIVELLLSQTPV